MNIILGSFLNIIALVNLWSCFRVTSRARLNYDWLLANKQPSDEQQPSDASVESPHDVQRIHILVLVYPALASTGDETPRLHAPLHQHRANHDRHGCEQVAEEAVRCHGHCRVALPQVVLQRNHGALEHAACTETCDDLEENDFRPVDGGA